MKKAILLAFVVLSSGLWSFQSSAQTYCTTSLYSAGCAFGDDLDNVTLNNIVQTATGCTSGSFADYTTLTVNAQQTSMLQFSVTSNYASQYYAIWIDINNDGDFSDPNEFLWTSSSASGASGTATSAQIVLPMSVTVGTHRLRVRGRWANAIAATESCTSFSYGETHDYTINVGVPPLCPQPYAFVSTGSTPTSISFSYTATGTAFDMEYGATGFTPGAGTTVAVTGTTPTLSGLTANTSYDFYVRKNCTAAGNGTSLWSNVLTVATLCIAQPMPFSEGFSNWPAPCWVLNGPSLWSAGSTQMAQASMGTWGSSTGGLQTPPITLTGKVRVKFKWSHLATTWSSQSLALVAQKSTSVTADTLWKLKGAAFNSNDGATWAAPGTMVSVTVNLDSATYANASTKFSWVAQANSGNHAWIDDVLIENQPACVEPTLATLLASSDSSLTFSWNGTGSSFNLEWGPAGFATGTGSTSTSATTSKTLMNLSADQAYDIYIQRNCGAAGTSPWFGPITFRTQCTGVTKNPGYAENWDAYTDGDVPDCWTLSSNGSGANFEVVLPSSWQLAAFTTPNYTVLSNNGTTLSTAVSPFFPDVAGNQAQIRFRGAGPAWGINQVIVGTLTTPSNPASWHPIDTITLTSSFVEYTVPLVGIPATHRHVGFRILGIFKSFSMDNFYYEQQPSCLPPTNASIASGTTTAVLTVAHGVPVTPGMKIMWGPNGFNPSTGTSGGTVAYATGTSYTLTGLAANTCYSVWVNDSCGNNSLSPIYGPIDFCTPCVATTMPYVEDFNTWPLSCWNMTGGTKNFTSGTVGAGSAANANFWNWVSGEFAVMTSKPVAIAGAAQATFTWSHLYMSSYPTDQLLLLVRKTTSSAWDTLANLVGPTFNSPGATITGAGTFVQNISFLPASYNGSTAIFRFVGNSGFGPDVFVDNFHVEVAPTCLPPTNLAATPTATTASVTLTHGGSSVLGSRIIWGPVGFNPASGVYSTGMTSTAAYTITGLSSAASYDVYAADSCSATDLSPWAGPLTITTTCVPLGMPYVQDFTTWPPVCWDLTGGTKTASSYSLATGNAAVFNFWNWVSGETSLMTTPTINIVGQPEVSFEWSHMYMSAYPNDRVLLRVRLASGTVWDTLADRVGPTFQSTGAGISTPGTFVKDSLVLGAAYAGQAVVFQFVGLSGFGPDAFIDNFTVESSSPCAVPTALGSSAVTCATAQVNFTKPALATGVQLEYGPAGFIPGAGTLVTASGASSHVLTGLTPGQAYHVLVRSVCALSNSFWSTPLAMTTPTAPKPSATATYSVVSATPSIINFSSGASGADTVFWTFSDGTSLTGASVQKSFTGTGAAWGYVTAINGCGTTMDTTFFSIGREELPGMGHLTVVPNPASMQTHVIVTSSTAGNAVLRVLDVTGKVIFEQAVQLQGARTLLPLDASKWANGLYTVDIRSTVGLSVARFSIQK